MNIRKFAFRSANVLTVAAAVLWVSSALAAPLDITSSGQFASVQDSAPADDTGSAGLSADLQRQVVNYPTTAAPGTIVIDTAQTYLYFVLSDGRAIRYGIGVGRDGFRWSGSQTVTRKAEWPDWTPPQKMIARQPYLPRWVAGGEGNPLGARAMYLGGTIYRIHGTNAPETIGTKVSSGCIRLVNADVIDLYSRVTVGTQVIVLPNPGQVARTATTATVRVVAPRTADLRATTID